MKKLLTSRWMILILFAGLTALASCRSQIPHGKGTEPVAHQVWDSLLQQHVDGQGMVNYRGFIKDSARLNQYLALLSEHPPDPDKWSRDEQLAYWLNAYNAFTIQLIIRHYPLESIKDIVGLNITFINSPWDIKFITIGGETLDLNNLEHGIIRKQFEEPRIHFALVCAAHSCPKLRNTAYVASTLDKALDEQARAFINHPQKNSITPERLELSRIFQWYKGDFTETAGLRKYIQQFTDVPINPDIRIDYKEYDWSLNEQP